LARVDVRSVVKRFGSVEVLHGVDVTIEDKSFVVLLGPSGCGKSTLLRMIAGLEQVSEGEIFIGGRMVNDVPPKNRDVAMVFQNYALYPHMKVYENMAFSLTLAKVDAATIREKVHRAAEILNLREYLDRYPRQLSGGQRQRVAMGRAIVRNPQVFLFDEPLSNLDAQLRVQMRTEIKALHQRLGSTSIYVTHDQIEAMTMADKIVVMRDGRIEQEGAPLEVYDRPRNLFVAAFIGSPAMNLIPGRLKGQQGTLRVETNDGIELPLPPHAPGREGQPVHYGVRPDHLMVANGKGVEATVEVVEPTGADTLVFARIGNQKICGAFSERYGFRPGERIALAPRLDCVHLFDAQSGSNLMLEQDRGRG
jgi:multiple sugar transport system ATP-binding protein